VSPEHQANLSRAAELRAQASKIREKAKAADLTEGERDFLRLAEPIKVGHHSEVRHRKFLERARRKTERYFELLRDAEKLEEKAAYWETLLPGRVERKEALARHLDELNSSAKPGKKVKWFGQVCTIKRVNKNTLTIVTSNGRDVIACKTICSMLPDESGGE